MEAAVEPAGTQAGEEGSDCLHNTNSTNISTFPEAEKQQVPKHHEARVK